MAEKIDVYTSREPASAELSTTIGVGFKDAISLDELEHSRLTKTDVDALMQSRIDAFTAHVDLRSQDPVPIDWEKVARGEVGDVGELIRDGK